MVSAAVAVVLLGLGIFTPRHDAARAVHDAAGRLEQHLTDGEAAVAAKDVSGAVLRWQDAYTAALATREWQPMIRVDDAAMNVASLAVYKKGFERSARGAYLVAHDRARRATSDEGALRAADGLAALGDERLARALRHLRPPSRRTNSAASGRARVHRGDDRIDAGGTARGGAAVAAARAGGVSVIAPVTEHRRGCAGAVASVRGAFEAPSSVVATSSSSGSRPSARPSCRR